MEKNAYHLPRLASRDLVTEITQKRAALKRRKRDACRKTASCDCVLCTGR